MLYDSTIGNEDVKNMVFERNAQVVEYNFLEALGGACVFTSQLDMVIIYFTLFEFIEAKSLNTPVVILMVVSFVLINQAISFLITGTFKFKEKVKSVLTFLLFGYGFTPMIRTFTTSVCTDTIYAVSWVAFVLSLVFQDYGLKGPTVSHVLSVNLGISASVFLISRMGDDFDAFWLLTTAICFFVYWPQVRNRINSKVSVFPFVYEFFCLAVVFSTVSSISENYLYVVIMVHVVLLLLFPLALMAFQPMKNTITGPWDILAS
uniref:Phosphatidylinositol N-acetylglucosaminyltransferase subunit C n=1 Tax=Bursaphelenchus xylophilus TaxID=6326 RepID=A0A1I7SMS1_BURXY